MPSARPAVNGAALFLSMGKEDTADTDASAGTGQVETVEDTDDKEKFFYRELELDSAELNIAQQSIGDVGHVVWDAAIVLCKFLDSSVFNDRHGGMDGKFAVELGAGTGVVGLCAALNGANCVITDLPELLDLMQKNVKLNRHLIQRKNARVRAQVLRWGEDEDVNAVLKLRGDKQPDYVLIADCLYYDSSLAPLISTISSLCAAHTTVLMSFEERTTDHKIKLQNEFFGLLQQGQFLCSKIPHEDQDPVYRSEDIHILKITKSK